MPMPHIQVLDAHVADLIAAGEVVERPASVVKELMENAIDAGAKTITVEIQHGGMSYIRVTDDGCGMDPADVETAFLRHATSKIRSEYDLEAIGTLGFRGEALAAVAAVARVEVLTRQPERELGVSLTLEGGVIRDREEAGGPAGTTMIVRDLFFNTPARLKYMKKDSYEGAAVFANVQREALAHPEVAVKFIREGKQELLTPGDGQLKSAAYAVLGRDLALGLIPVHGTGEEHITVEGFASMPACCRGSRSLQFFFVNGRFIKSRTMMAALEEAYKNQHMVGKFPGCVLHVTTRLGAVDVNVHPAKTEVKFVSDKRIFDAVYHAVKGSLEGEVRRPQAVIPAPKPAPRDEAAARQTVLRPPAEPPRPAAAEKPAAGKPGAAPAAPQRGWYVPAPARGGSLPLHDYLAERRGIVGGGKPVPAEPKEPRQTTPPGPVLTEPAQEPVQRPLEPPSQEPAPTPSPAPSPAPEAEPEPWAVKGELFQTYILVEQGETAFLIDKHAAHERMNFDKLKAEGYTPMAQVLLTPAVFTPGPEEGAVLLQNLPLLSRFGFVCEDFGGGAVMVRQAPDYVDPGDIESTLVELAGALALGRADPDGARDAVMATMACKAAIKGGQKNGPQELQRVAQAVMSGAVRYCPHGRPVAIELSRKQLEKLFKRA